MLEEETTSPFCSPGPAGGGLQLGEESGRELGSGEEEGGGGGCSRRGKRRGRNARRRREDRLLRGHAGSGHGTDGNREWAGGRGRTDGSS